LELNTRIGDPAKLGRDCEIHQHRHVKYTFVICYIRMMVFVDIIWILMFYNVISFFHWFPDANQDNVSCDFGSISNQNALEWAVQSCGMSFC
jgi:hypothetical protein